jgi:FkbM family methyltransferase
MKQIFVYWLVLIIGFSSALEAKHKVKTKHKHSGANIVSVNDLPFELIAGSNRNEVIHHVCAFPRHDYEICSADGFFYCDWIDDVIKNEIRAGRPWKTHWAEWIRQYAAPGSIAIDVGAHIGTLTLVMAKAVGPDGLVIAFEPQPKLFREFFWNMSLNNCRNIKFFCAGVGGHEGSLELSPLRFGHEGWTACWGGTGRIVPMLALDSFRLTNVSLIKISAVGQEEFVLDGARDTIVRNRPVILIEICEDVFRITKRLEGLGYTVYPLEGIDFLALPIVY